MASATLSPTANPSTHTMTHASSIVSHLRSVALNVPDLAVAEAFFTQVWHLDVVSQGANGTYLRGTGTDHHLISLHAHTGPASVRHVSLRVHSAQALEQAAQAALKVGARVLGPVAALSDPAGGVGLSLVDAHGRVYQLVHGDHTHPQGTQVADKPMRLAHAVLNTHDVPASQTFLEQVLDFSLSDRTRIMAFMRCNSDHHSIAFGDTDNDALNHIAFLMPDLESVMRGGGRLKDAGHPIEWGPGRHGPGNNAFNYFIGPFGIVVEYTAEVQQIDDSYTAGQPDDWKWPTGRVDHWGISKPPSDALKQAQRSVLFAPV